MKFKDALEIGDEILIGKYRKKKAIVKGFGVDKNKQPTVKTNKGERNLFAFRIKKLMDESDD